MHIELKPKFWSAGLAGTFLIVTVGLAQVTTGTIRGTVVDCLGEGRNAK